MQSVSIIILYLPVNLLARKYSIRFFIPLHLYQEVNKFKLRIVNGIEMMALFYVDKLMKYRIYSSHKYLLLALFFVFGIYSIATLRSLHFSRGI